MNQKDRKKKKAKRILLELSYFPILILYLEIVFHLYMKLDMSYLPVFGSFAISMGLLLGMICHMIPNKVHKVVRGIISILLSVLFCVEVICKDILQQYFQLFSAADTAMGNRLSDYSSAIIDSLLKNWFGIVLLLVLPGIYCAVMTFRVKVYKKKASKSLKRILILLPICLLLYMISLAIVYLGPWKGDFTPKKLYKMDTNTDDQVEQLGIITMLRLDAKHAIFGVPETVEIDIDKLEILIEEEPKEIVYEPNVLELDLPDNENVEWLSDYIQTVSPTMQNEYTGLFEGYNVIFITAEGFSGYMIDPEVTPTLYRLANEGFVFKNFYSALHFTSTSGGEFQNLTGLYPKNGFPISMTETGKKNTYLPFTLANILNEKGYISTGYHFNENMYGRELSHPNLGYDWRQASRCENPIQKEIGEDGKAIWPQSDDYMIEQTVKDYIGQEPFNIYYLTLSGHLPYGYNNNRMSKWNREAVEALPYTEKTKAYIAANLELEKGLTRLITELENAGIADQTLIVMAPDHIPYSDLDVLEELAGKSFGRDSLEMLNEESIDFEVYRNTLIMWSGSMQEPVEVEKVCCQVDILPTLLNLLGVEYDSRLFGGTDILSTSEGLVIFSSNSWISDKGLYNRFTGEFTPNEENVMTEEEIENYVNAVKTNVSCRLAMTSMIIENDYYRLLFENDK